MKKFLTSLLIATFLALPTISFAMPPRPNHAPQHGGQQHYYGRPELPHYHSNPYPYHHYHHHYDCDDMFIAGTAAGLLLGIAITNTQSNRY